MRNSTLLFSILAWHALSQPRSAIGIDLLIRILPSFTAIFAIITGGVTSIISIIKRKDRAIFLFISALMGFLGLLVLLGEFLIPH